ncbi:hypothetical protein V6N13_105383 [Hibiscus sabdariffa]
MKDLLFYSKLRALLWCKASDKFSLASEVDWWSNPYACFSPGRLSQLVLTHADTTPVFRVYDFRKGDQSACGGLLVIKGAFVRALFSGPIVAGNFIPVDLFAVKVELETYLRAGWTKKDVLFIELDNKVLVYWILNPSQRPWGVARSKVEIDNLVCKCVVVHFKSVASQELAMAETLAQDGIDKRDWLIGWW